jgi:hypothetical protein
MLLFEVIEPRVPYHGTAMLGEDGVRPAYLYHGTSLWGLIGILASNAMSGSDWDGPYGTSFTRSLRIAQSFSTSGRMVAGDVSTNLEHDPNRASYYQTEFPLEWGEYAVDPQHETGGGGAILAFDRDKLKRKFGRRLRPTAAGAEGRKEFSEFEERLLGEAKGILDCLLSIKIIDPDKFNRYQQIVLELDPDYKPAFDLARKMNQS